MESFQNGRFVGKSDQCRFQVSERVEVVSFGSSKFVFFSGGKFRFGCGSLGKVVVCAKILFAFLKLFVLIRVLVRRDSGDEIEFK